MLRESLQRWIGSAVTGEVTLRLRRGDDYSILDTSGPAFSYHPDKLSMERTEDSAFGPVDRIGQLTMRNLDIADSRAKLELFAGLGMVGTRQSALISAQPEPTRLIGERFYIYAAKKKAFGSRHWAMAIPEVAAVLMPDASCLMADVSGPTVHV